MATVTQQIVYDKGAFKYYVIALGGFGCPASIADADDALRGGGESRTKMMT